MPVSSEKPAGKAGKGGADAPATRISQADLVEDAPAEYTVVKGDTLWGISGRFLKDPWKWPLIWQMNQEQIKNPHLIYPGDVVRLDRDALKLSLASAGAGGGGGPGGYGPSGGTEAQAVSNVVKLDPRIRVEPLQASIPSIPGTVIGPFLSQPLVVDSDVLAVAPAVIATEEGRVIVGTGGTVYVDRLGTADGVNWQVFRQGEALRDPDTGEVLGFEAKYVADARVKRFGNPTTIEVVRARQEVNRGDRLAPARESAFPAYVPHAPDKVIDGRIRTVDGGVSEFGQYSVITINRGARDGVEVGHVLASYHRGAMVGLTGREINFTTPRWFTGLFGGRSTEIKPVPVVPDPPSPPRPAAEPGQVVGVAHTGGPLKLPDERNGLVFVFRVFDRMSYALVMRSTAPIYVGDVVKTP
jgi:hypothetical protein